MKAVKRLLTSFILCLFALFLLSGKVAAGELSITLSGNGSDSVSTADVVVSSVTNVTQTNTATVKNNVDVNANTGGNTADNNTGGDTTIETGDIDTEVNVVNVVNSNRSPDGEGTQVTTQVSISDNGTGSNNSVTIDLSKNSDISQANDANIENNVDIDANTGNNSADNNTGGVVKLATGGINTDVSITNCLNINTVGGNSDPHCPKPQGGPPPPSDEDDEDEEGEEEGNGDGAEGGGDGDEDGGGGGEQALTSPGAGAAGPGAAGLPTGEILGVSILPITGSKINLWLLAAAALMMIYAGAYLVRKSYVMEYALVRKYRGRYYNKDTLRSQYV